LRCRLTATREFALAPHYRIASTDRTRQQDKRDLLRPFFAPTLSENDMAAAEIEGWIFGLQ